MLILTAAAGSELPKEPLELLCVEGESIPVLTPLWLQVFLSGFVFDQIDLFNQAEETRKQIERRLRKLGLIEGNRVKLIESRAIFRVVAGSLAKLDSIVKIATAEHKKSQRQITNGCTDQPRSRI